MSQPDISPTRFTLDELKLISRALNLYKVASYVHPVPQEDRDIAAAIAVRIYRENFRIGVDNEPPLYAEPPC